MLRPRKGMTPLEGREWKNKRKIFMKSGGFNRTFFVK
jgi:hypothetical protein